MISIQAVSRFMLPNLSHRNCREHFTCDGLIVSFLNYASFHIIDFDVK